MSTFQLSFNNAATLSSPLVTGGIVKFVAPAVNFNWTEDPTSFFDNTHFDLLNANGDVVFAFIPRRQQNRIVFNTKPSGGGWQTEQDIPLTGVFSQNLAVITIAILNDKFKVLVNGTQVKEFTKRIQGDVASVKYSGNPNQVSSPFGSPIIVDVTPPIA